MEEIKKLLKILVRTYDRTDHLREAGRKGMMLLELLLNQQDGR
jgi:hypothetical protein